MDNGKLNEIGKIDYKQERLNRIVRLKKMNARREICSARKRSYEKEAMKLSARSLNMKS